MLTGKEGLPAPKAAVQFGLGEEFGPSSRIDEFIRTVIEEIPNLVDYSPLFVVILGNDSQKTDFSVTTLKRKGKSEDIVVIPNLDGLDDYVEVDKSKPWGLVFVVPQLRLESILPQQYQTIKKLFEGVGEVTKPGRNRVWFVEREINIFPAVNPKDLDERELLKRKKHLITDLDLCEPVYHRTSNRELGWFEARPHKKRKVEKKDISSDPEVQFLRRWMKMVVEFRGGEIVSEEELERSLKWSRSKLYGRQRVADLRGVYSRESCGCIVHTSLKGIFTVLSGCQNEANCFSNVLPKPENEEPAVEKEKKPFFILGKRYSYTPCPDCGEKRYRVATWADPRRFNSAKGILINYHVVCSQFENHSFKGEAWVDPGKILNPGYIFRRLHPKKEEVEKKAA